MPCRDDGFSWRAVVPAAVTAGLLLGGLVASSLWAPIESTMGHVQRVLYVHVSVAWLGLLAFVLMAATSLGYLLRRDLIWDTWSQAANELGWLFAGLTLITGSLWARAAWHTWWTWDPRLTTSFILWLIYSGCLLARGSVRDPVRRARVGAILALLGMLDLPLVIMATRWFRGMHPVAPQMEPAMRVALLLSLAGFTAVFLVLLRRRQTQLLLEYKVAVLEQPAVMGCPQELEPGDCQPRWARNRTAGFPERGAGS